MMPLRRHPRFVVVLAALGLAGSPGVATAQSAEPAAPRNAAAEELFDQGRALLDEGRYAEACPKLAESQRLDPSAGTLLNLADCFDKSGQTASAWVTFKEAARASADRRRPDWERLAQRRAAALEPRLSRLVVEVAPGSRIDGLSVLVDQLHIAPALYETPIPFDPGPHVVTAEAPGHKPWRTELSLAQADRRSVSVPRLESESRGAYPVAQSGNVDSSAPHRIPWIAWVFAGASVALAGTGAALWVVGRNEKADLAASCGRTSSCAHDDITSSRAKLIVGDVLVGAALVALGTGVVFALSPGPAAARISVAPLGLRGVRATVEF